MTYEEEIKRQKAMLTIAREYLKNNFSIDKVAEELKINSQLIQEYLNDPFLEIILNHNEIKQLQQHLLEQNKDIDYHRNDQQQIKDLNNYLVENSERIDRKK